MRSLHTISMFLGGLALVGACGGTTGTTGTGGTTGTTGTGGTTGSGGSSTSTGASAGTGGSTTSSTTATTSTTSTTGSGTGGSVGCQNAQNQLHLQGTVDGQDLVLDKTSDDRPAMAGNAEVSFGNGGLLYLSGGVAVLRLPSGGPLAGKVYYAATATLTNHDFSLSSLVGLGVCPAATGQGTLSFCFDTGHSCPQGKLTTTTGALDGTAFDWGGTSNYQNSGASPTNLAVDWQSGAWLFAMHDGDKSGGNISAGVLSTPGTGPDAGAFWCADGGYFSNSLGAMQVDVAGLTRLGTPAEGAPASGSIEGCY
jgi:hypothetical protein